MPHGRKWGLSLEFYVELEIIPLLGEGELLLFYKVWSGNSLADLLGNREIVPPVRRFHLSIVPNQAYQDALDCGRTVHVLGDCKVQDDKRQRCDSLCKILTPVYTNIGNIPLSFTFKPAHNPARVEICRTGVQEDFIFKPMCDLEGLK